MPSGLQEEIALGLSVSAIGLEETPGTKVKYLFAILATVQ